MKPMRHVVVELGSVALLLAGGCASSPPATQPRPPSSAPTVSSASPSGADCQERPDALVNGVIHIRPGETLCIQLRTDGEVVTPVALVSNSSPDTLVLTLAQDSSGTLLTVRNPLSVLLRYQAAIRIPGRSDSHRTSTCPVLSHRFAMENWPQKIDEITLSGFRTEDEGGSVTCM
jgi:hypothetical protein